MWSAYAKYVRPYTNYTYRCVHLMVHARVDMPGISWGNRRGQEWENSYFERSIARRPVPPLFILHRGNFSAFVHPTLPRLDPGSGRIRAGGGARAATGPRQRGDPDGGGTRAEAEASPVAQPCRLPASRAADPSGGPAAPPFHPRSPTKKTAWPGQSCRRCSGRSSPSRGMGPILPFAVGSLSRRGRAFPQPRGDRSSPANFPACGLRATEVRACLALYFFNAS